jgi:hypothetical protein
MDAKKLAEDIAEVLTRKIVQVQGTETYFIWRKGSKTKFYIVDCNDPDPAKHTCRCDSFIDQGYPCKHHHAIQVLRGAPIPVPVVASVSPLSLVPAAPTPKPLPTLDVAVGRKRSTNAQRSSAYVEEPARFEAILHQVSARAAQKIAQKKVAQGIAPPPDGRGRPSLPDHHRATCLVHKVYRKASYRNVQRDLERFAAEGRIRFAPNHNSMCSYGGDPNVTELLREILTLTASPTRRIEREFIVDSTGFHAAGVENWRYTKGKRQLRKTKKGDQKAYAALEWMRAHIMSGRRTGIIPAARITLNHGKGSADSVNLPMLIDDMLGIHTIHAIIGDRGYISENNLIKVLKLVGAWAFIKPKRNFKPSTKRRLGVDLATWYRDLYKDHGPAFKEMYRFRPLVEAVFSAIKRRFGDFMWLKNDVQRENELLCKLICHNICILIQLEMQHGVRLDYDTDPAFGVDPNTPAAPSLLAA